MKNYLASLRRNIRERGLKIFMEQLSSKTVPLSNTNCAHLTNLFRKWPDDLLSTLDSETMRLLAMQRVQQLILNPESRSLTVFPFPDTFSSANKSPTTTVNQPWLQSADVSDTGDCTCPITYSFFKTNSYHSVKKNRE